MGRDLGRQLREGAWGASQGGGGRGRGPLCDAAAGASVLAAGCWGRGLKSSPRGVHPSANGLMKAGSWRAASRPCGCGSSAECRVLTESNGLSAAAAARELPVPSPGFSLTPCSRCCTRGGDFLTAVSLSPPTRHPLLTEIGKKKKRKRKKSGVYTDLRKCFKTRSQTCDLWEVTGRLRRYQVLERPAPHGELLFPPAAALPGDRGRGFSPWRAWRQGNSDSVTRTTCEDGFRLPSAMEPCLLQNSVPRWPHSSYQPWPLW